jgi:hypothetical protein
MKFMDSVRHFYFTCIQRWDEIHIQHVINGTERRGWKRKLGGNRYMMIVLASALYAKEKVMARGITPELVEARGIFKNYGSEYIFWKIITYRMLRIVQFDRYLADCSALQLEQTSTT